MFEVEDLREASRDARRALYQERERCEERMEELDGYLKVMDGIPECSPRLHPSFCATT